MTLVQLLVNYQGAYLLSCGCIWRVFRIRSIKVLFVYQIVATGIILYCFGLVPWGPSLRILDGASQRDPEMFLCVRFSPTNQNTQSLKTLCPSIPGVKHFIHDALGCLFSAAVLQTRVRVD